MKLALGVKLLVGVGVLMLMPDFSGQAQGGNCLKVGGSMLSQFVDEKTGQYQLTGDLQGGGRGLILEQKQDKGVTPVTTTVKLEHTFVTSGGDLLQTKGDLGTFIGAADFANGQGVLRYNGQICTK
jgi:hypothetical protein